MLKVREEGNKGSSFFKDFIIILSETGKDDKLFLYDLMFVDIVFTVSLIIPLFKILLVFNELFFS